MNIGLKPDRPYKVSTYKTIGDSGFNFTIRVMQIERTIEPKSTVYCAHVKIEDNKVITLPQSGYAHKCSKEEIEKNVKNYMSYLHKLKKKIDKWRQGYALEN